MAALDEPARRRAQTQETGHSRDLVRPPSPEPLAVPVTDSHCHLDIADGDDGAEWLGIADAVRRAAEVGVARVVQVGYDVASSQWSAAAAEEHPAVVAAVAVHPNEAPRLVEREGRAGLERAWDEIARLAALPRVRAVGETGMDAFRTGDDGRAVQEESFRRHIALAKEAGKALVIHDRDAHDDVLRILESEGAPERVVFHCFSGGEAMARHCADRGWFLSFAGTVTFKNAQPLRDALVRVPGELLLVETDAPYLTPAPFRGRPNASYLVPHIVRAMADTRGDDLDTLCAALHANATTVFGPW